MSNGTKNIIINGRTGQNGIYFIFYEIQKVVCKYVKVRTIVLYASVKVK